MELRPLGNSPLRVTPVALGCWPIAGMTSIDVNEADSLATLHAALECGINFFDTAYCYGAAGESERLIARALGGQRQRVVLATKGGIHWNEKGERQHDARPATLRRQCEESLRRLATDHVDLLYLHAPDPAVPLTESAGELARLQAEGKTRSVGVSNCSISQLEAFQAVCPLAAVQPAYNMLQRQIEADVLPWCRARGVAVVNYWPLMKGLLAGRLDRSHAFEKRDGRAKYPMFQGEEWQKNQDFLDELRAIAGEIGKTVSQVVINWTIHQPGITAALCGSKRAAQVRENAGGMEWQLDEGQLARIAAALARRGEAVTRPAV